MKKKRKERNLHIEKIYNRKEDIVSLKLTSNRKKVFFKTISIDNKKELAKALSTIINKYAPYDIVSFSDMFKIINEEEKGWFE